MNPTIVPFSAWSQRAPKSVTRITRSDGVGIHYPGSNIPPLVASGDYTAVVNYLRGMQRFHMDTHYLTKGGGSNIAYRWLVDAQGRAWEGRGWGVAGGDQAGANSSSHGVQLIVTLTGRPTDPMIATTRWLIAEHDRRYGKGWVRPHQDIAGNPTGTTCAGPVVSPMVRAGVFDPYKHTPTPTPIEESPMLPPDVLIRDNSGRIILVNGVTGTGNHLPNPDAVTYAKGLYFVAGKALTDNTADAKAGQALIDNRLVVVR